MATRLRKLRVTRVDRVWAPANGTDTDGPLARIVLAKARAKLPVDHSTHSDVGPGDTCPMCGYTNPAKAATETGETMPEEVTKTDEAPAEPAAADPVPAEDTPADETPAEPETAPGADEESDSEDVDKSALPEAVRKRLERAEAVAKAAEARVAKMEHEAEAARWLEVAKGLPFVAVAKKVGGDAATDTAALLHGIAKAAGEAPAKQLLGLLEAAQERLAQSELLKERGTAGTGTLGSAGAQLEKAADQIRKDASEAGNRITKEQAYQRAVSANPELALKAQEEDLTRA